MKSVFHQRPNSTALLTHPCHLRDDFTWRHSIMRRLHELCVVCAISTCPTGLGAVSKGCGLATMESPPKHSRKQGREEVCVRLLHLRRPENHIVDGKLRGWLVKVQLQDTRPPSEYRDVGPVCCKAGGCTYGWGLALCHTAIIHARRTQTCLHSNRLSTQSLCAPPVQSLSL